MSRLPRTIRLTRRRAGRAITSALLLLIVLLCLAAADGAASQTPGGARRVKETSPLATKSFHLSRTMEVGLEIEARSPGASWARRGSEAAALSITIDGSYSQDLLLWAGDKGFLYRVMLGRLRGGKHTVAVALNLARSASGARRAEVVSLRPILLADLADNKDEDELALAHSPILFARANTIDRFTDIPLLMYYEASREAADTVVRYTVIFSNEDGGTPTAALMARWGRATDIEWVYQARFRAGRVVEETYQGVEHETKPFMGERANGDHPLLAVASDNNNFSDLACSAVRFAPLPLRARLEHGSREQVMDSNAWTYRVMAEELKRENRISDSSIDPRTIADPRQYLYVEAFAEQKQTAISVEVAGNSNAEASASDLGNARLRVEHSGFFRIAVRLPANGRGATELPVSLRCHPTQETSRERRCEGVKLVKAFLLDDDYTPRELRIRGRQQSTLSAGEAASFHLSR